ncbi:hypothetical protein B5M09_010746 [Aphanomyces astaci]|uniref:Uncharacterized protein n=1 Tax=Aphanomyces astaci TaxID=112090 RepID=A0A3R7WJ05_APHAT|nr:hypothetical protein B5M09_010746 [Aphanomyces astaci]
MNIANFVLTAHEHTKMNHANGHGQHGTYPREGDAIECTYGALPSRGDGSICSDCHHNVHHKRLTSPGARTLLAANPQFSYVNRKDIDVRKIKQGIQMAERAIDEQQKLIEALDTTKKLRDQRARLDAEIARLEIDLDAAMLTALLTDDTRLEGYRDVPQAGAAMDYRQNLTEGCRASPRP